MATKQQCQEYRRQLKKRAFTLIGMACVFCKADEGLHAAHVAPTKLKGSGRGLDRRYRDVIANPASYAPMCQPCHRTFDRFVSRIKTTVVVEEPIPF